MVHRYARVLQERYTRNCYYNLLTPNRLLRHVNYEKKPKHGQRTQVLKSTGPHLFFLSSDWASPKKEPGYGRVGWFFQVESSKMNLKPQINMWNKITNAKNWPRSKIFYTVQKNERFLLVINELQQPPHTYVKNS